MHYPSFENQGCKYHFDIIKPDESDALSFECHKMPFTSCYRETGRVSEWKNSATFFGHILHRWPLYNDKCHAAPGTF